MDDLMALKEPELGYSTLYEEIRETCKNFTTVQNSAAIESVAQGRVKVKVDAAVFAKKFEDTFRYKKHAWAILSDYANLFANLYKRKKGVNRIQNTEGAPVSLELIVFAFGELGKPSFNNLVGKV